MKSYVLREKFLEFFKKNGHKVEPSSSVIPAEDPTILFANAGMNQFKDLFLGNEKRSYNCATTSQKCIRAGGKHNDLDQVGFTDRHLTFFEMLGNFSFGAYFKREAIKFAWTFLTEEIGLDKNKLSVTVHYSDEESYNIWRDVVGVLESKISKLGDEDNFWQMGDTGPCGPCTEIFFDRGEGWDNKIIYGEKATRYLEIWNLVFMQFNQQDDGQRLPLKQRGVDTGMGLERLCMVMNNGETVYDTDLFAPIIEALEEKTKINYKESDFQIQAAFNVVADHIRTSCMIIADSGLPSNDGRGYVLRKIIRRALLFLKKLTSQAGVFTELANVVATFFAKPYPDVYENLELIKGVLNLEIVRFGDNLQRGQKFFDMFLQQTKQQGKSILSGEQAFKLYDTYGFPPEVSHVLARENGLTIDIAGFEKEMQQQRLQSAKNKGNTANFILDSKLCTKFVGYEHLECDSEIIWLSEREDAVWIATAETPFFAACGGQVSDSGSIFLNGNVQFLVKSIVSLSNGENQKVVLLGLDLEAAALATVGVKIRLVVDKELRANTAKNHTATHLLQAALQQVFGKSVQQSASLVDPDYLRFGFTLNKSLTLDEIFLIEKIVNAWICDNLDVSIIYTNLDQANAMGAMALFGEKYNPETVRVVSVGDISVELCGGTHVRKTGDIGCFKIVTEDSMGSGVRCIIAKTGPKATRLFSEEHNIIKLMSEKFSCRQEQLLGFIDKTFAETKTLQREIKALRVDVVSCDAAQLESRVQKGCLFEFLSYELEFVDQDILKILRERLVAGKNRLLLVTVLSKSNNENTSFTILIGEKLISNLDMDLLLCKLRDLGVKAGLAKTVIHGSFATDQKSSVIKCLENLAGL